VISDFDFLHKRSNGLPRVVLAGFETLLVGELKPGEGGAHGTIEIVDSKLPPFRAPVSVRITDLTGDGVQDLAVGNWDGFVEIHQQQAVLP
jgi:hypothetical protein